MLSNHADEKAEILFGGLLAVGNAVPGKKGLESHKRIGSFIKAVGHPTDYDAVSLHPYAFAGKHGSRPSASTEDLDKVTEKVEKNIRLARSAMEKVRKDWNNLHADAQVDKAPIWITELGWPVAGHGAHEDTSHLLVNENVQKLLLEHTFSMIKV